MSVNSLVARTAGAMAVLLCLTAVSYAANPFLRSNFEVTEADVALITAAAERLYADEVAEVGAVETWDNEKSGNYGSVTLVLKHAHEGLPCRRLQHDIKLKSISNPYRFIVDRCKMPDGDWKVL